jgi:hypothetical protein
MIYVSKYVSLPIILTSQETLIIMNNCIEFLTTWYMPIVLKDKILPFKAFINVYVDEIIIIHAVTILKHEHIIHT